MGEVGAVAGSVSGQKGAPRSTELSQVHCSTMCRSGSKQQYLTCALKPSLFKYSVDTEEMNVLHHHDCLECKTCMVFVAGRPC